MTTQLHLAEVMSFQTVTHHLTACCIFSHNHAILEWDNLFNTEAQEFFHFTPFCTNILGTIIIAYQ